MNDKSLGSIIFAIGLFGALVYTLWLFWPANSNDLLFYLSIDGSMIGRWAVVLPIFVAVIAILIIAMWIGWTMAVTPPPMMIDDEVEVPTESE